MAIEKDTVEYSDPTPFDGSKLQDMDTITKAIRHKQYGKDVREPIAQLGERLVKIIAETGGDPSAEVVNARGSFDLLGMRETAQENAINEAQIIAEKAQATANSKFGMADAESYLKGIAAVPETFANLAAIQAKYPSGKNGLMVTADTGHKYIWNGKSWADAGVYQATGIADGTVTTEKLAPDVNEQIDALSNALARRLTINAIKYLENSSGTISLEPAANGSGVAFKFRKPSGFAYIAMPVGLVSDFGSGTVQVHITNVLPTSAKLEIICASDKNWIGKVSILPTVILDGDQSNDIFVDLNSVVTANGYAPSDRLWIMIADRDRLNNDVDVSVLVDVLAVRDSNQPYGLMIDRTNFANESNHAETASNADNATNADHAETASNSDTATESQNATSAGVVSLTKSSHARGGTKVEQESFGTVRFMKDYNVSSGSAAKGVFFKVGFDDIDAIKPVSITIEDMLTEIPSGAKKVALNFATVQSDMVDWGSDPGNFFVNMNKPLKTKFTVDVKTLLDKNADKKEIIKNLGYFYVVLTYYDGTGAETAVFDYRIRVTSTDPQAIVVATALADDAKQQLLESVKYEDGKYITCWGDSLTAQGGWTGVLSSKSGLDLYNAGTGGEGSRAIVARQGADAMIVNNVTIPAGVSPIVLATNPTGGFTTVSGQKVAPLRQGGMQHFNPCRIGNVMGTLAWTGTNYADKNGSWTFTRTEDGDAVSITRPTALQTAYDLTRNSPYLMVIFMGQNDGTIDPDEFVRKHRIMIEHAHAENTLILGLHTGTAESRADYEAAMTKAFGRYFFSLRQYLASPIKDSAGTITSCYGLDDAGLTPTADDLAKIAVGQVPLQLLADGTHYTDGTKTVVGNAIYRYCCDLNIFDEK